MLRSLLRGILRSKLEKQKIHRPGKHVSREFKILRGTKFVEGRGKTGKYIKEMPLSEVESISLISW